MITTVDEHHTLWNSASRFNGGHVFSIAQTGDGYLWIGTSNGLMRFDGSNFVPFRADASEAPANPSIVGVATDGDGQLWASNGLQMFHFVDGRLRQGLPEKGQQPNQDIALAKGWNGDLLLAAGLQGIALYEHGRLSLLAAAGEVPSVPVALAHSANGTLWIGTRTGLYYIERNSGRRLVRQVEGLLDTSINSLLCLDHEHLLIGTDKGLRIWDGNSLTPPGVSHELEGRQILALAKDLDGNVWVGTSSGLFRTSANHIDSRPGFPSLDRVNRSTAVTALYADREGNMWVGGQEGIEGYRANAFTTYLVSPSVRSRNNGPVYVDEQARTWYAPSEGGLFWFRHNLLQSIDRDGLNKDGVYSIAGGGGEVWAGRKRGGLTQLRLHGTSISAVTYTTREGLAQDAVYSVYRSPDGVVWAGTLSQGLTRLQHGNLKTFTTSDGLPSNTISAIAGTSTGVIFAGTPNGLGEFRDGRWTTYTALNGLPPGAIDSLLADRAGTLWIGTTKGIAFLRSGAIQVPAKVPDPLSEDILGIAESEGWLWISTPNHVVRVRRDALQTGVLHEQDYREYGDADGLASVEGVKRNRSVVADERGRIWLSLNRGISVVQPAILARRSAPPLIHLEQMLADDKNLMPARRLRVASGVHRLTFDFASVSLTNPDQIRYRYRLDDFDSAWSEPVSISQANYTNVPPGKFRFRVMARNADGLWSAEEAALSFEVEPAYWQTRLFQLVCFVACCLLAWGLYRLRLLQLTRRLNLRFEERLAERTRIGRELHDTLLQNLTGLALQISGIAKIVKEPVRAAEGLQQLKSQAEDCVRETRQSVWDIRSAATDVQDLPSALKHSGRQLTVGKPVRFGFVCQGVPRELPLEVRQHLLRIAGEAIGNAVRHAAATEIQLKLHYGERDLQLIISDNGVGFDIPEKKELAGHFGLTTMKERAHQIRASIQIESTAGQGTCIAVRLPRKGLKR